MGFFNKLFKQNDNKIVLNAPVKGKSVPLSEVSDPTFGEEILGKGVAIQPTGNQIFSPCDGTVDLMFDTGHAVNLKSSEGVEILIHVGLDTVSLKGEGFKTFKKTDESVKKGDLLIEFDREKLIEKGFDVIVPMVICNTDEYKSITSLTGNDVDVSTPILEIEKN